MPSESIHVLLVDGDDRHARVLRAALAAAAPSVDLHGCASLPEAAAILEQRRFDAMLLAVDLSDSSGLEPVQRMRACAPDLPIVALTADGDPDAGPAALRHGAQDVLTRSDTDGRLLSRVLRYAVGHARDRAELMRREQHFRALIEHAGDIILVLALDGRIRDESPAFERVLGYPGGGLTGTSLLDLMHADDRDRGAAVLLSWSQPSDEVRTFACRLRHRDGNWRAVEAVGRRLEDHPEHGIVVNARDVTDRVRAEEALCTLEARLRQVHKMEAVGRLAGGIAHDFNNVLTAIYGYADLLLDDFDRDDVRRADVEEIRRSAERAAALTRQLLAFSRQQVLQPQVLDLNAAVADVHRMIARLVGTDVLTRFEPAVDLRPVLADKGQIEQVLMNLAANARDAMPDGGTLVIRTANRAVSAQEAPMLPGLVPGDYVCLVVSDSGMGMTEHVRQHIFEPFFTTKEQGQGTGLGLATAYGIVKQSNGGIYVESEEHQGTTFTIYLPPHQPPSATSAL